MGVFHVFKIVQMVPNRAKSHISSLQFDLDELPMMIYNVSISYVLLT